MNQQPHEVVSSRATVAALLLGMLVFSLFAWGDPATGWADQLLEWVFAPVEWLFKAWGYVLIWLIGLFYEKH